MSGGVKSIDEAYSWPLSRLALCFKLHRQTILKRIQDAGIRPSGTLRGNPTYDVSDVAEAIFSANIGYIGGDPKDPESFAPSERKAWFESEKTRLQIEERTGQLVPAAEVERVIATMLATVAQGLRAIPDNLERRSGCSPEVSAMVQEAIDAAMDSVADELGDLSSEDADE